MLEVVQTRFQKGSILGIDIMIAEDRVEKRFTIGRLCVLSQSSPVLSATIYKLYNRYN
jgi:hypothetical protein